MPSDAHARSSGTDAPRVFAIVASKFNGRFVQGLVDHATAELRSLAPSATVTKYDVPGAFEIPVVVREIAKTKNVDAVLALGVILQGSTTHAEHLSHSVTNALQQIALEYGVPVINAVLGLQNEEQAEERCLRQRINRGVEAAQAAVEVTNVLASLRANSSDG